MRIFILASLARAMGISFKIGGRPYGASPKCGSETSATQSLYR